MSLRRRGFSLIELLIVIVMLAVLSAILLPRVRIEQVQVDTAARTITSTLQAARADAVARGHNVLVVFDTGARVLRTVWDANNNLRIDAGEKTRPAMLSERVVFGLGSGIAGLDQRSEFPVLQTIAGNPALVVQRNGALDRGGTFYLTSRRGKAGIGTIDARALRLGRATASVTTYVYARSGWKRQ